VKKATVTLPGHLLRQYQGADAAITRGCEKAASSPLPSLPARHSGHKGQSPHASSRRSRRRRRADERARSADLLIRSVRSVVAERCRGLPRVANPAYLSRFLFYGLPCVAPYCVPGGVRVVSEVRALPVAGSFAPDGRAGKGDGLPATPLIHARPRFARMLVSRCRARPRPPRTSRRLAGPYR
jgi:hypothetical protein